jgi:colanic acid biosynthesis glycosyl transferase WcaI
MAVTSKERTIALSEPHLRTALFATFVGGGPVDRLASALRAAGAPAEVSALFDAETWRAVLARSLLDRLPTRAKSLLAFPLEMIRHATSVDRAVLIPTTNPFYLPAVALATRRLHRKPVVPLVYDMFPDAFEAHGWTKQGGAIDWLATRLNRWWLRGADGVVFIGKGMAEHACARYATPSKWTVIETGADAREFENIGGDSESDLERWCEGKRIIAYVGKFGPMHDWETLSEAIPRVLARNERVGMLVVASGVGVTHLKQRWKDLSSDVVRFVPPIDDKSWARLLVRTNIALATLRVEAAMTSIPSKTFSSMAAGSAIVAVAPAHSDLAAVVRGHGCGEVVPPGDVDGLVGALNKLLGSPVDLQEQRTRAVSAVRQHYDIPRLAERWQEFLERIPDTLPRGGTGQSLLQGDDAPSDAASGIANGASG